MLIRDQNLGISRLRLFAMASVVLVHAFPFDISDASYYALACLSLLKFGTISFFFASGYLIGKSRYENFNDFFAARLGAVFVPWLIWISIFAGMNVARELIQGRDLLPFQMLYRILFHTSYWFIINFFCTAWIYSRISTKISERSMFLIFLIFSLIYGVNVHFQFFVSTHTMAIFGYLLFIHLGVLAYKFEEILRNHVCKWGGALCLLIVFFGILSIFEAFVLIENHINDALNTLRISNQIYSILIAVFLAFSSKSMLPAWIPERAITFPLYLIHPVIMLLISIVYGRVLAIPLDLQLYGHQIFERNHVLLQFIKWLFNIIPVFALSVGFIFLIRKFGFSSAIGSARVR